MSVRRNVNIGGVPQMKREYFRILYDSQAGKVFLHVNAVSTPLEVRLLAEVILALSKNFAEVVVGEIRLEI